MSTQRAPLPPVQLEALRRRSDQPQALLLSLGVVNGSELGGDHLAQSKTFKEDQKLRSSLILQSHKLHPHLSPPTFHQGNLSAQCPRGGLGKASESPRLIWVSSSKLREWFSEAHLGICLPLSRSLILTSPIFHPHVVSYLGVQWP